MRALVVGGGPCGLQDYIYAKRMYAPDIIIAVNHVGLHIRDFDHWVSLHADELMQWNEMRLPYGLPTSRLWSAHHVLQNLEPRILPMNSCGYPWDGTSSALGIFVARVLGAKKILMAGVPLEDGPHFYIGPMFTQSHYTRTQWEAHKHELTDVRSMGGWTRQLLGGFEWSWWS